MKNNNNFNLDANKFMDLFMISMYKNDTLVFNSDDLEYTLFDISFNPNYEELFECLCKDEYPKMDLSLPITKSLDEGLIEIIRDNTFIITDKVIEIEKELNRELLKLLPIFEKLTDEYLDMINDINYTRK